MKKFLWCLFDHSLHGESVDLNKLIYKCIWLLENCPDVEVEICYYHITIKTKTTEIKLWNTNKFYAWLSSGSINGKKYMKSGCSSEAKYDFKECLKRLNYNIYAKDQGTIINIDAIKC